MTSQLPALPANSYNRFNPDQGYKQHLFRAAKGLQSPEMNEVQAQTNHEMKTFMDAEFGDGSMLAGGLLSNVTTAGGYAVWRGAPGTFYAQGYHHNITQVDFSIGQPGSVAFPNGETCSLGIILHVDVVDETQDPALRDPAPGTKNFGNEGAARLRYKARFGRQTEAEPNDWFYHRLDFTNGFPGGGDNTDANIAGLVALVAEYDRNANGNYIVRGNYVSYIGDDYATNSHILQVSAGQTNVFGYEQKLDYAYNIEIPTAKDAKQVLAEPITYTGPGTYTLRNTPVAAIGPQVNGFVEVTQNVIHGAYNGAVDPLPNTPVVSISQITQATTTYTQGTDYVQSGDRISWINAGRQPAPGSTYTVTYRYSAVFSPSITGDLTGINVSGLALNTVFFVDYTYYIPRYDIIVIDQGLKISSTKGSPSPNPVPPTNNRGLILASVYVSFGAAPKITNSDQRRPLTSDLVTIQHSLEDIKYNLARLTLQDRLTAQDPVTVMKGIFVDPFTADTFRDAGVAQNAEISAGILYMAVPWYYAQITDSNAKATKTILGYSTTVAAQNLTHSCEFQINQFVGTTPPPAYVQTWPPQICWIDQTIVNQVKANPYYVPYWAVGGVPAGIPWAGPPGDPRNQLGAGINVVATTYAESMITTPVPIPPTRINYYALVFNRYESVRINFDNRQVAVVTADGNGQISGSFTTPTGTLSGVKPIQFIGQSSGVLGVSSFTATPFAMNVTQYIQQTVYYDPLAETFGPTGDAFITDVIAWVTLDPKQPKPIATDFVDCLLLATQVGLPDRSQTVATARLYAPQVNNADVSPYLPTRFVFPEPVQIDGNLQYALVLATPNSAYYAWGCELGQYDLTYGRWISAKPTIGTLLESSNSATWLPRLKDDLTYVVNKAVFQPSRSVTYPTVTVTHATDLMLLANIRTPSGTSIRFTVTLTVASKQVTYPITPDAPLTIPLYSGPVVLNAVLTSSNPNMTPAIDPNVSLAVASVVNPSVYITRSIPVPANAAAVATTLKVYLEVGEIDPNTVLVEYLKADGVTWQAFDRDVAHATQLGFGIVDMPFTTSATAMVGASQTRLRITLTSIDPALVRRSFAKNLRMYFS